VRILKVKLNILSRNTTSDIERDVSETPPVLRAQVGGSVDSGGDPAGAASEPSAPTDALAFNGIGLLSLAFLGILPQTLST
jgi:hypothetical protein